MSILKQIIIILILVISVKTDFDDFDLLTDLSYASTSSPQIISLGDRQYFLAYIQSDKINYLFIKNGVESNKFTSSYTVLNLFSCLSIDKTHISISYQQVSFTQTYIFLIQVSDGSKGTEYLVNNTPSWQQYSPHIFSFSNSLKFVITTDYYHPSNYPYQNVFKNIIEFTNISTAPTIQTGIQANFPRGTPQLMSSGCGLLNSNIGKYLIAYNNSLVHGPGYQFNLDFRIFDDTGSIVGANEYRFYTHQNDRTQNLSKVFPLDDGGFIIVLSNYNNVGHHPRSSQQLWIGSYQSDHSIKCTPAQYKTYVPNSHLFIKGREAYITFLQGESPNITIKYMIFDLDLCTASTEIQIKVTNILNSEIVFFMWIFSQDLNTKVITLFYPENGASQLKEYFFEQISNCTEERCYSCFGDMVNACTLCSGTTLTDRKNRQRDDNQLCICDDGYFEKVDVFDCQQCAPQCSTCTITATNCGACLGAHRSQLPDCPCEDTYFEDSNGDCQSCDSSLCFSCVTNEFTCTSCSEGKYFENNNCLLCNPICKSCLGPDQCQECSPTNTNRSTDLPNCPCQANHFDASDIANEYVDKTCTACENYCSSCNELVKCLSCKIETNRTNVLPFCFCNFNYYSNSGNCEPLTYVNTLNCENGTSNLLFQQWQSFESSSVTMTTGHVTNQAHQFAVGEFLDFKEQQFGSNDITITFYIKINTFVDGQNIMTFNKLGNQNLFVNLIQSGSDNGLEFGYTSNGTDIKSKNLILENSSKNDWQFITFSYSIKGKIMVYMNIAGKLSKQVLVDNQGASISQIFLDNSVRETCKIGNFDGIIDQFSFFNARISKDVLECLGNICQFQCNRCQENSNNCQNCSGNRIEPPICDCPEGLNSNAFNPFCQKNRNNCVSIPENGFVLGLLDYTNNGAEEDQQTVVSQKGYKFDDMQSSGSDAQQLKSNIKYTMGQEFSVGFWMNYLHFTEGSENLGDGMQSMNIFTAYQEDGATRKDFSIRIDHIKSLLAIGIAYYDRETNLLVQYAADKIIYEDEGWVHIYVKISYYDWEIFKNGISSGQKWKSPMEIPILDWYLIWGGLSLSQRWSFSQGLRYNGYLDEFLVYNRILSNSEIMCLADKCDENVQICYNEAQLDGYREQCDVLPEGQIEVNLLTVDLTTQNSKSPIGLNAYLMDEEGEFLRGTQDEIIEIGSQVSISFWYKIDNPSVIKQTFFSFSDGVSNSLLGVRNGNTRLIFFQALTTNGDQKFYCFDCIEYYTWKHIVIVLDKKRWQIFLDGNEAFLDYETNLELPQMQLKGELLIAGSSEGEKGFGGYLDQFLIFNKSLTFSEVRCLYDRCDLCKENREGEICDCPMVTYDINKSYCNSCNWGCLECTNLVCLQCVPSTAQRLLSDSCVCPVGYYDDNRGPSTVNDFTKTVPNPYWECLECNYKCISCYNFLECTVCKQGIARQPQPYCECEYGYYDDLENPDCKSCQQHLHKYCLSCEILKSGNLLCLQCQDMLKFDSEKQVCQCPPGTYTLDLESTVCEECINNASCLGGNELLIDAGYWRESKNTDVIIECINSKDNCLGGVGDTSSCSEGNIGALCEACDIEGKYWGESYGNYKDYKCRKCKDQTNIWETISQILFILVLAISMLNSTIDLIKQQQINRFLVKIIQGYMPLSNDQTIYLKILTHYFYILQVITTFNLELPGFLSDATQTTGNPSKSIGYAFDCFLHSLQNRVPHNYFKVIWQIIVFCILVLLSFVFIVILSKTQQKSSAIKLNQKKKGGLSVSQMFFQSLICMFIFYQPSFVQNMVDSVACKTIDGKPYVVQNTSIKCYEGEYNEFSFFFIMPLLIVWIALVPAFFFRKLYIAKRTHRTQNKPINQQKQKKQISPDYEEKQLLNEKKYIYYYQEDDLTENRLQNPIFQNIFGFLYIEYSQEAYFWELVKIGQKLLIVIFLGFHSTEVKIKGILIFIVIFFYGLLLIRYKPYLRLKHTIVDLISTCVSGMSIILGLFIYQNQYPGWTYTAYTFLSFINVIFIMMIVYFILFSIYEAKQDKIKKLAKKNSKLNKILEEKENKKIQAKKNWKILQQRVQLFVMTKTLKHNLIQYQQKDQRYEILLEPKNTEEIQTDLQFLQDIKSNQDLLNWKKFKREVRDRLKDKFELTEKAVKIQNQKKEKLVEKNLIMGSSDQNLKDLNNDIQQFPTLRKQETKDLQLQVKNNIQIQENSSSDSITDNIIVPQNLKNSQSQKNTLSPGSQNSSVKDNNILYKRKISRISQKSQITNQQQQNSERDEQKEINIQDQDQEILINSSGSNPRQSIVVNNKKKRKSHNARLSMLQNKKASKK